MHYTPHAQKHAERCELCRYFISLAGECHRVKGEISPSGWCELFKRAD